MPQTPQSSEPISYAVVGSGYRSQFYLRPPGLFPERLRLAAVVSRTVERATEVATRWGASRGVTSLAALADDRPDFVVVCLPREHAHGALRQAVDLGIPALCETPPAADLDGLRRVWADLGPTRAVQVAEQYPLYPGHAARHSLIASGRIGDVTTAQVSSTHLYHAVAIMRRMLGVGFEDAVVTSHESRGPLVDPRQIAGWSGDDSPKDAFNLLAFLAFASGKAGLYDFSSNQWWNPLRPDRIVVRGSRGEILNDEVTALVDARTPVTTEIRRRQTGLELNLEGFDLDHLSCGEQVLYRNRWQGGRLADDEIAVCELLEATGRWARGAGDPPYPLAEGCQDHALGLAITRSQQEGGTPVTVGEQPWWN